MSRFRLTERKRLNRIRRRIHAAGAKGMSVKEIARHEGVSISRAYYYLRLIRAKRHFRVERLGKKFYYIGPSKKKTRRKTSKKTAIVELRGYFNYTSSSRSSRNIDIDCVILVQQDRAAILAGSRRISEIVERRLGRQLASMLKFGVAEATPESANHFRFRRHGGEWIAF